MTQISVEINKQSYTFQCRAGEEERLAALAETVKKKVDEMAASVGQVGEARLLVMAALMLADELNDARAKLEQRPAAASPSGAGGEAGTGEKAGTRETSPDSVSALEALADQMDALAAALEAA